MVSAEFSRDFEDACEFFGIYHENEKEAFKVLCRGNMDAAVTFVGLIACRVRADPRFGINDRIRASIQSDKNKLETKSD